MSTSNEYDDFIQELIENIYISLEQTIENENKKDKFKAIVKGVIDFLKENSQSMNEIRTGLIDFFHLRRSYIKSEYQMTFQQIGIIVEGILANDSDEQLEINLSNYNLLLTGGASTTASGASTTASSASTTVSGASTTAQFASTSAQLSSSNALYNLAMQLLAQPNIQNSQPIVYTYQPYMGLPTINVPTSTIPAAVSDATNTDNTSQAHTNSADVQVPNLSSYLFNIPISNLNNNNESHESGDGVEDEDGDDNEIPPLIPTGYNSATNLLLNFVNIYLNSASIPPLGPMVDVKNVVTEKQLEQLKVVSWSELKPEETEKCKDCAICLDSFEKDSKLRILKCAHGFHVDCIDKWLTDCNYKCPVCRDDSNEHHAEI